MCCQLSQHTNTHCLAKLQSLVSCPNGGEKKFGWWVRCFFTTAYLLAYQACTNSCFPYTAAAQQEQKTCLLSLISSRQHPRVSHRTLHLWEWEQLRAFASVPVRVFFSIKYNIPSHLERDLIWPRGEAVPEEVGKHKWERQRNKLSLSQPKEDFWWWAPRFSNQLKLCLAFWTLSPILEVMLTILVL